MSRTPTSGSVLYTTRNGSVYEVDYEGKRARRIQRGKHSQRPEYLIEWQPFEDIVFLGIGYQLWFSWAGVGGMTKTSFVTAVDVVQ